MSMSSQTPCRRQWREQDTTTAHIHLTDNTGNSHSGKAWQNYGLGREHCMQAPWTHAVGRCQEVQINNDEATHIIVTLYEVMTMMRRVFGIVKPSSRLLLLLQQQAMTCNHEVSHYKAL